MLSSFRRIALALFALGLIGLCGCGMDVRVSIPIKSNVEHPIRAKVVKVPPGVAKNFKLYPDYALAKQGEDPAATINCLAIDYLDVNRQPGNGPYLVKLDAPQVKRLTEGARLVLVLDGKNTKIPMSYSFE